MNNKYSTLIFFGSFLIGGSIGWLVHDLITKRKTENYIHSEIEKFKSQSKIKGEKIPQNPPLEELNSSNKKSNFVNYINEKKSVDNLVTIDSIKTQYKDFVMDNEQKNEDTSFYENDSLLYSENEEEHSDDLREAELYSEDEEDYSDEIRETEERAEFVKNNKGKWIEPYVIMESEFENSKPNYDKVCLTFYARDCVLTENDNMPIDDIAEAIGADGLYKFGQGCEYNDIVYIRNDNIATDFEVLRVDAYFEEVQKRRKENNNG